MGTIPLSEKGKLFALFFLLYFVFYVVPNFLPAFEPRFLPLFPLERELPLLPWTFLIYISDYLLLGAVILGARDRAVWDPFVRQAFATLMVCGVIFFFFPTTYPRPAYPEVENGVLSLLMYLVRNGDTPNNCFPSMHVAMTSLAVWTVRGERFPKFVAFLLWGVAIILSTLTTKQHYILDIFGGVSICAVIVAADRFMAPRFSVQSAWLRFARKPR